MKEITLKEWSAYLPHGLKFIDGSQNTKTLNPEKLVLIVNSYYAGLEKMVLRNLSDLTKEIENNGEKFVPQKRLSHLDLEWLINSENLIMKTNYEDVLTLISWKFNVFHIPDELIVRVTEDFNPYK